MEGTKVWDNVKGWGEIIKETDNFFIVRWDGDPWFLEQIPKGGSDE